MLFTIFFQLLLYIFNVFLIQLDHLKAEVTVLHQIFLLSFFPDRGKVFDCF